MTTLLMKISNLFVLHFWASPHHSFASVTLLRDIRANRRTQTLKAYDPGFPHDAPMPERPGNPTQFPTDVPAPDPHDVPAPEPIDVPPPDPGEEPEPKKPPKRPQQDPKPRPIP